VLLSKRSFAMPLRLTVAETLSRRIAGQDFTIDLVQVDDNDAVLEEAAYAPAALAALPVCNATSYLTFTTVGAHGLRVDDRVVFYGQATSTLNIGQVSVTSIPSATTFTVLASGTTVQTYGSVISGYVAKVDPLGRATHGMGMLLCTSNRYTSTTTMETYSRGGNPTSVIDSWSVNQSHSAQVTATAPVSFAQPYTYAATPGFWVDMHVSASHMNWSLGAMDSLSPVVATAKRAQILLDPAKRCKIRIRALNLPQYCDAVKRITFANKATVTTTATLTVPGHAFKVNDTVFVYGISNQTVFANTSATVVTSVDGDTITVVMGASASGTGYGGVVVRQNGGVGTMPAVAPYIALSAVQSIVVSSAGRLVLQFAATPATWVTGESVCVVGLADSTAVYPAYEGLYRLANVTYGGVNTVELDPLQNQDLSALTGTITCGGTMMAATDFRIHSVALLEYTRHVMEVSSGKAHNDAASAVPTQFVGGPYAGLIGAVNPTAYYNVATLGTAFTTNIAQTGVLPAVNFIGNGSMASTKYFGMLSADRMCDFMLEHSADNVIFDASSPRIAAIRQAGETLSLTFMSRTGVTVSAATTTAHSFRAGQWVVIRGSTYVTQDFNGSYQISQVPSSTTFTFTQPIFATEIAGVTNATVTSSAKFSAQVSAPAILQYARARIYNTSALAACGITSIARTDGLTATITTALAHGLTAGDVVGLASSSIPYVSFERTQFLDAGARTLSIGTNGGFTCVVSMRFTGATADSLTNFERLFGFGNSGTSVFRVEAGRWYTPNTNLFFSIADASGTETQLTTATAPVTPNEWGVFAFRYIASSATMQILKSNAVIATLSSVPAFTDRTVPVSYVANGPLSARLLSGDMRAMYIYDRALSDAEMTALYTSLTTSTSSIPATPWSTLDVAALALTPAAPAPVAAQNEWPRAAMTAASSGGCVASASSVYASELIDGKGWEAFRAFDKAYVYNNTDVFSTWHSGVLSNNAYTNGVYTGTTSTTVSGSAVAGEWLQIQLPGALAITSHALAPRNGIGDRLPTSYVLAGSNDGVTWTSVDARTGISGYMSNIFTTFTISSNTTAYAYYRLIFRALGLTASGNVVNVGEWKLFSRFAWGTPVQFSQGTTSTQPTFVSDPFPAQTGVVLATPSPTALQIYSPGANTTTSGGTVTPVNGTSFVSATIGATTS